MISLIILGIGVGLIYLLITDRIRLFSHDTESKDISQFITAIVIFIATIVTVFIFAPIVGVIVVVVLIVIYRYFTKP